MCVDTLNETVLILITDEQDANYSKPFRENGGWFVLSFYLNRRQSTKGLWRV
jgi:hypothetical protein